MRHVVGSDPGCRLGTALQPPGTRPTGTGAAWLNRTAPRQGARKPFGCWRRSVCVPGQTPSW